MELMLATQIGLNQLLDRMYSDLLDGKEPNDTELRNILDAIRGKSVIVYGAGRSGTILARLLADAGIGLHGFVDRNWEGLREIDGIEVRSPQSLEKIDETDNLVIIGAGQTHLVELIVRDLDQINPRLSRVSGVNLVYILHYNKCREKIRDGGGLPPLKDCISYHVKPYKCPIFCRHVEAMSQSAGAGRQAPAATLNDFGYQVGEFCTLKCEHCHEAVPYLNSSKRLSRETILRDLQALTEACTFVHRLDLVGGEPFAHPEIAEIIHDITSMPKLGYIGVFTNGTVVPSPALCDVLRNDRIIVTVSDYSHCNNLSEPQMAKIHKTVETLRAHEVSFIVIPDRYWFDMNGFEKGEVPAERLKENYSQCFMAACHRVYDGVLYHCPYQAAGIKLGKLEKRDCVEIHKYSLDDLIAELNKFDTVPFIDACRYCNLPKGPREVIAGKQLELRVIRS